MLVSLEGEAGRRMAAIRVRDDGEGIGRDLLPRLFQPFVQADRTLDSARGGLGLGLALTKGLFDEHGGEIAAHSDGVGKGAEFTVRLPMVDPPPADEPQVTGRQHPRGARRVLVIEDNADAADGRGREPARGAPSPATRSNLPQTGRPVSGRREFKPDVVLCDIGLSGMDAYEVARAVRADAELRAVRLVALTGYALPEDLSSAMDAGFDQHLAKPVSVERLQEVIAGVNNRS